MSGTPVALLIVLAIIVLAFGAVLTAGETALMRMTRAAAEDLVQDQRRGAGRVLALAEKRGQVLGSVAPIRVAVNMLAAVLLTLASSGLLDRWWQVLVVAVVLNIVLLGLVVGFSPRSVGRRHPDGTLLVLAGVLDFQDAVRLVHKRGAFMQEAVPVGEGAMAAVLGLERDKIVAVCEEISQESPVQAVNFNCPGQTVIAGAKAGVEKATEALSAAGAAKCVILPVSAPFHSTLMAPAARKLAAELDKVEIRDAAFPVVSNYTGELESKAAEIKENLVKQADHPVKWEDCVAAMVAFGATHFVEAGPGKTLCGFNKRIDRTLKNMNVENPVSLEKTLDTLKEVR